jgi:hypothetical protein
MPVVEDPTQQGRTASGLDANERLPNGALKRTARAHPEDFTRNTGAGATVEPDRPPDPALPRDPDSRIIPSDSPGG